MLKFGIPSLVLLALTACAPAETLSDLECDDGQFLVYNSGWECGDALVGAQGPAGADGLDGVDGLDGADGMDGADGADGLNGTDGVAIGHSDSSSYDYGWGLTFSTEAQVEFTLLETRQILLVGDMGIWGDGTACKAAIQFVVDGDELENSVSSVDVHTAISGNNLGHAATSVMMEMGEGTHVVELQRAGCAFGMNPHLHALELQPAGM